MHRSTTNPGRRAAPRDWPSRPPAVRWDRLFVALALLFGVFFAIATPPLQEHDAPNHVVRIDEITKGRLAQPIDSDGNAEPTIDACTRSLPRPPHGARRRRSVPGPRRQLGGAIPCTTPGRWGVPNSALTSPVPYAGVLVGYGGAKAVGAGMNVRVLAGQFTGLAVYVVAVWGAIRLAPHGRSVLFMVALLPSSLALTAGLHPDSTGIWASMLVVALVLGARERCPPAPPRPGRRPAGAGPVQEPLQPLPAAAPAAAGGRLPRRSATVDVHRGDRRCHPPHDGALDEVRLPDPLPDRLRRRRQQEGHDLHRRPPVVLPWTRGGTASGTRSSGR